MQFSIISLVAALAATASASVVTNGTSTAYYPTGTGAATVSSTGTAATLKPTSTVPFVGGADRMAGSVFGLIVAGGVALML